MRRNRRPLWASTGFLACALLVVACGSGVCWWLGSGRQMSLLGAAGSPGWGGGRAAQAETALPATPWPTPAPLPTATPWPTPSPTPRPRPAAGPPTRITAPAINLDARVVEIGYQTGYVGDTPVTEWQIPANAAGVHRGSAYPGNAGNIVLSGHNNIQGEVFRYVSDLEVGDEVFLYVGNDAYRYVVSSKEIIQERGMPLEVRVANAQAIAPGGEERVTLVTCWPYTSNTHRVIVVAMPAPLGAP